MTTPFDAGSFVLLPRLHPPEALALGAALLDIADESGPLPEPIEAALRRLRDAHQALGDAVRSRVQPRPIDPERAHAADVAEDAAWGALHDWLLGWAKLGGSILTPEARRAGQLYAILFPDGLQFTLLAYKIEWAEADMRLRLIERDRLEPAIVELGGGPFLDALRLAHREYGVALGITTLGQDSAHPVGSVRLSFADITAALKRYILRVAAHADDEHPATVRLAATLLRPIAAWEQGTPWTGAGG